MSLPKPQTDAPPPEPVELYQKHVKIYPREVTGRFARLRTLTLGVLLGLYYGLAWLQWDGQQLLLFDLPARKFHVFGLTFWPQDFFYLAVILIIAALSLFFFTALAGRLWCGYACPQTVWTEIFLVMERWIEGNSRARLKLDQGPVSGRRLRLKTAKHALWLAFSLWTGFTFVGYFTPIRELSQQLIQFQLTPWEIFWILFYGFATYGNAGFLREQVCIYMCPYARFQSAMFDRDTMIISYDERRGDPRGARRRNAAKPAGLGDCIDCTLCVQACPTGIDIRDGLQYQCIGCAACIDVCDDVMAKMGYAPGLIRYTTENAIAGTATRLLRPRVIAYALLLSVLTGALIWGLWQRIPLEVDIMRDRSALYHRTDEGLVENVYHLKIINMSENDQIYDVSVEGIAGLQLLMNDPQVTVAHGSVADVPLRVRADPSELAAGSNSLTFHIRAIGDPKIRLDQPARFIGPAQ